MLSRALGSMGALGKTWKSFKNLMNGLGDKFFELLAMIEEPDRDVQTGEPAGSPREI